MYLFHNSRIERDENSRITVTGCYLVFQDIYIHFRLCNTDCCFYFGFASLPFVELLEYLWGNPSEL